MHISIRRGVFETNSSSTHAIVLNPRSEKGTMNYDIRPDAELGDDVENGFLAVHFGEYGWYHEDNPLSGFRDKLSYLLTYIAVAGNEQHPYMLTWTPGGKGADTSDIENEDDWGNAIQAIMGSTPDTHKVFQLIQSKCPWVRGIKFYWYDPKKESEIQDLRKDFYSKRYLTSYKYTLPMRPGEEFFQTYKSQGGGKEYAIGFGYVDGSYTEAVKIGEGEGTLTFSGVPVEIEGKKSLTLEEYLFDDGISVVIANDNDGYRPWGCAYIVSSSRHY